MFCSTLSTLQSIGSIIHQAVLVVKSHLQMVYWLIHTSLLMSVIFSLFTYCLGLPFWLSYLQLRKKQMMDLLGDWLWQTFKRTAAFIHLTVLKNTVTTWVTDGANPKHCKDTGQLNFCGTRQIPCPETKLASRGIAPCLLVTVFAEVISFKRMVGPQMQFLMNQKSYSCKM